MEICSRNIQKNGTVRNVTAAFMALFSTWEMGFLFSRVMEEMDLATETMVKSRQRHTATNVTIRNARLTSSSWNIISISVMGRLSTITFSIPTNTLIMPSSPSSIPHKPTKIR